MPSQMIVPALLAALAIPSAARAQPDPAPSDALCPLFYAFAAATPEGAIHRVRFETDWGGAYERAQGAQVALRCDHDGDAAGQALCAFLNRHVSIEFPQRNFERLLRCMGAQDTDGEQPVFMTYRDAEAQARSLPGVDADTLVTVGFVAGSERAPPTLTIVADATWTNGDD